MIGATAELIAVRPDERFDEAKLADFLRGRLAGSERPLSVRQFGGGAANLTYLLDYGSHEYVLRRPPLGPVAKSAHDMGREFKVLSVLHQRFPYAPRAFVYSDDEAIIGAPFFVMERRQGAVVRRAMPTEFAKMPDGPRRMSAALVDALALFHGVDYGAIGLEDLGRPAGFITRQIEGWYKRWLAVQTHDLPAFAEVYHWLRENEPKETAVSLVHNDYKLDNVMLSATDPGQMVAIFDWDMCTLGDPLCDVGTLLTYWTEPDDPPYMQMITTMPLGQPFMTRRELVARYAEKSGRSVHDIHFYHALGLYRLVVIIAQIYIRYQQGQTQDERFAPLGDLIPLIAKAAREIVA